jgi:aryl-alcohol dehydrogenase-like predicted oxidoreductase
MKFRTLGNSGLQVSLAGLGTNNFGRRLDQDATTAVINTALDEGINFFDTATSYGDGLSEEYIGKALGARRHDVVIASKFGWPGEAAEHIVGGSRRYIFHAIDESLRRLNTDYIDLYQFHKPDPSTPLEETLDAMSDLVRSGKVRYLGTSNFSGWQISDAEWTSASRHLTRCVSAQNQWSLLNRSAEPEVIPACEHHGVGMLPFFPLASGFLTGKYQRDATPPEGTRLANWGADYAGSIANDANWSKLEALTAFATQHGHTVLELALSWLASQPVVSSVIAGATSPEQVSSNVAATHAWELSAGELSEVDGLLRAAS